MAIRTKFIVEAGRRRASSPGFYENSEEYIETLPGYTQRQITGIEVWKLKLKK